LRERRIPVAHGTDRVTIGLDIDGIFADFVTAYARVCSLAVGRVISTDARCWDWVEQEGVTPEEVAKVWAGIFADPYFWACLPPLPGAEEALRYLDYRHADHSMYFLTHRPANAKFYTEQWLRDHGFEHPTVLLTPEKGKVASALKFDVFLDDKPENVSEVYRSLPPEARCYLMAAPYNTPFQDRWREGDGIKVIDSLDTLFQMENLN
jgi:uncharacterized HAD superfamily protein